MSTTQPTKITRIAGALTVTTLLFTTITPWLYAAYDVSPSWYAPYAITVATLWFITLSAASAARQLQVALAEQAASQILEQVAEQVAATDQTNSYR